MTTTYNLCTDERALAERMAKILLESPAAQSEIDALEGRVFLDDTLQGWTPNSLRQAASTSGGLSIQEDFECPPDDGSVSIGDQASRGIIVLGYYRAQPRQIVLFPEAIRLVADLPEFTPLGSDPDLLFRSVLFHEIGHWLTLHPSRHSARVERCLVPPSEEAETLTEILSWLTFAQADQTGVSGVRNLLQCQNLKRSRGPLWQYQVYPFWLFATGLVTNREQLVGAHTPAISNEGWKYLTEWSAGADAMPLRAPAIRNIQSRLFPKPETWIPLLPGFDDPPEELVKRTATLAEYWSEPLIIAPSPAGEEDLLDALDI